MRILELKAPCINNTKHFKIQEEIQNKLEIYAKQVALRKKWKMNFSNYLKNLGNNIKWRKKIRKRINYIKYF